MRREVEARQGTVQMEMGSVVRVPGAGLTRGATSITHVPTPRALFTARGRAPSGGVPRARVLLLRACMHVRGCLWLRACWKLAMPSLAARRRWQRQYRTALHTNS